LKNPTPPIDPSRLISREFSTSLAAPAYRAQVEAIVHGTPAFNASCLVGECAGSLRIVGWSQSGDLLARHVTLAEVHRVTVQHRLGDQALADTLIGDKTLGLKATRPGRMGAEDDYEDIAYFLESVRREEIGKTILIADSAIESAHDCGFDEYDSILDEFRFLQDIRRIVKTTGLVKQADLNRFLQSRRKHLKPVLVLHEGKKIPLLHRVCVPSDRFSTSLRIPFARLPAHRLLIGYLDEYEEC
jgi:hypothetical protein